VVSARRQSAVATTQARGRNFGIAHVICIVNYQIIERCSRKPSRAGCGRLSELVRPPINLIMGEAAAWAEASVLEQASV
jgi:hypothetical protein